MSMQDPVSDLLTQIRNGQKAGKFQVQLPSSKLKVAIVKVLQESGYIAGYEEVTNPESPAKVALRIKLKYYKGKPVISFINRVSKPSVRVYSGAKDLPKIMGGLGISVVSTSKGVLSDAQARALGQGGEVLCEVY